MKFINKMKFLISCVIFIHGVYFISAQNTPEIKLATGLSTIVERTNNTCLCVPYYLCDKTTNKTKIDGKYDGYGLLGERYNEVKCPDYVDVCCHETLPEGKKKDFQPSGLQGCGIRNIDGLDIKILARDKDDSALHEFPWVVSVLHSNNKSSLCGGTLIHPQIVLTAAHCVWRFRPEDIIIRAGEWDTQTTKERLPHVDINIKKIINHPKHENETLVHDLSLLILTNSATISDNINTICLPNSNDDFNTAELCIVAGWGQKKTGTTNSDIMKKIILNVVDRAKCQQKFKKTRLGTFFELDDSFICAAGIKHTDDACNGDGGGPLVCPIANKRYTQVGIVSWGLGCGLKDVPGVYASITKARDWIDAEVSKEGFDTSYYTQKV